jgi:diguanylate cyclase (GGDEF)-like protein
MSENENSLAAIRATGSDLIEILGQSRLFRDVPMDTIAHLLLDCEELTVRTDEVLLSRNAPNGSIYVILTGRVSVHLTDPDDEPASYIGFGECAGEMSVIDGNVVSADVIAREETRVLRISQDVLWAMVDISHAIARNLLYILSTRVRYGNELFIRNMRTQRVLELAATVDALTGINNRGWMEHTFPRVMARCADGGRSFCCLLIDIDSFKRLNDTWGHVAGDQALAAVAASLVNNIRPEDLLARFGGEEFVIGLPNTGLDEAFIVAERVRRAIEFLPMGFRRGEDLPHLTISIGIGRMQPGQTLPGLITAADEALYRAKSGGRNRVML